jgi:hypothetical protein
MKEANYSLPDECRGGLCVDAGCNIGDFPMNNKNRFDKYICYDVFQENIDECKKNTDTLGCIVEIHKKAVWSESGKKINVMAYRQNENGDLQHFGNSGNVGCIEIVGDGGQGWTKDNVIDTVETICIEDIKKTYGNIKLLKVDVEGSEYNFLLNKDLSNIDYIVGEFHFEKEKKDDLDSWICKTHDELDGYYKLKTI